MTLQDLESELGGGTHGPVLRVGDTVRRTPGSGAEAVHALLHHLESVGFNGAPRYRGYDTRGREILTFLPGAVAVRADQDPLPEYVRSDAMLTCLGRLIRQFHDATVGFSAPPGADWAFLAGAPRDGDVICHNDLGPWNTVFRDGWPVAFIDWDGAAPGPRSWDMAYAAYRFVPFVPDEICSILGWTSPPDRQRRVQILCDSYGIDAGALLETIALRITLMIACGEAGNAAGNSRFGDVWMDVMRQRLLRDLRFVQSYAEADVS